MHPDIPIIRLEFALENSGTRALPLPLGDLRRRFPAAFAGVAGRPATGCPAGCDCPCCVTFGQVLTTDPAALRRYQKPSLPFVLHCPMSAAGIAPDEVLEVELILIGTAGNFLESYIAALGKSLPEQLRLLGVSAIAADERRVALTDGRSRIDTSALPVLSWGDVSAGVAVVDGAVLEFLTPLRLLQNGAVLRNPSFPVLAGTLFRRISSLAYYLGGVELDCDFKWLAECSRNIRCRGEGFRWVNLPGVGQGCLGRFELAGALHELSPFLQLGELFGLGKGAAYGMGRYRLLPCDSAGSSQ